MRNKDGKIGIIIVLVLIILTALAAWFFAITRHFNLLEFPLFQSDDSEPAVIPGEVTPPDDGADPDNPDDPDTGDMAHSGQNGDITAPKEFDINILSIAAEFPDLFGQLNDVASDYNCAAVSLVVYDGDTGDYFTYEYGNANISESIKVATGTKFRIASLSKLVTAICALTLVDEGLIGLDIDVSNYFGYEVKNPHFPDTPITARMLMQHTSSIFDSGAFLVSRDNESSESVRYLIERGSSFRRNKPGTLFEYSNFGYAILGSLCERVTGKSLDTFAREVIFDPLGIDAAFVPKNLHDTQSIAVLYDDRHEVIQTVVAQLAVTESDTPGHDLHLAHANLTISAVDYAKILAMLGGGGELDGVRILSSELVNQMHDADVDAVSYNQGLATRYSVGDFIAREGFYWHTGSSHGSFSQNVYKLSPNRGVVVITTGAAVQRLESGMIDVCNDLSKAAWKVFG